MAGRWLEQGGTVGLLGLFDTPARSSAPHSREQMSEARKQLLEQAPALAANLVREYLESVGLPMLVPLDELARLQPEQQVERLLETFRVAGIELPEELARHARRLPDMARLTLEASWNYQPRFYKGKATVFCAAESIADEALQDRLREDWKAAAAQVEFIVVPGGHRSIIFGESNARQLAARIEECLKQFDEVRHEPG